MLNSMDYWVKCNEFKSLSLSSSLAHVHKAKTPADGCACQSLGHLIFYSRLSSWKTSILLTRNALSTSIPHCAKTFRAGSRAQATACSVEISSLAPALRRRALKGDGMRMLQLNIYTEVTQQYRSICKQHEGVCITAFCCRICTTHLHQRPCNGTDYVGWIRISRVGRMQSQDFRFA